MKKLFTLAAVAAMMFSCSKSEDITPDAGKLPINISVGQQTRANDEVFEDGDEVGIYVVNYDGSTAGALAESGNQADNSKFTYSNSVWTPDETIYWKDANTAADFYAYYPYSASANISAHPFSVQADQSTEDAFWASDFLWGKTANVSPTPNAVSIQTNHSLSRIIVNIKPGEGFTAESWATATKSVKICDVKTSATIDLSTGVASAIGNAGEVIPLAAAETGTTISYKAMIVPQVVADNSKLVVVTVDGTDYVYRKGYTFSRNTVHTFTVTVNKSGSSVDVTIGEWDIDNTTNEGDAMEETIPNNQIWYTSTDGEAIEPTESANFGANILSNTYENGKGVITFDGEISTIGGRAFYMCHRLASITLPYSVTSIENPDVFEDCDNLAEFNGKFASEDGHCIVIDNKLVCFAPAGLTTYVIPECITEIGVAAFFSCDNIESITIPESVTKIEDRAFYNCNGLKEFRGKFSSEDGKCLIVDNRLYSFAIGCGATEYVVPSNVSTIDACAFEGCASLVNITIPENVNRINIWAFRRCTNLTSIYFKSTTPPAIESSLFDGVDNYSIYVPSESVDAYKEAGGYWDEHLDKIFASSVDN